LPAGFLKTGFLPDRSQKVSSFLISESPANAPCSLSGETGKVKSFVFAIGETAPAGCFQPVAESRGYIPKPVYGMQFSEFA
jgi:hypothetical protein